MDRKSMTQLKFDKRLVHRRGWIKQEELKTELAALPDVADKIAPDEPEPPESPAPRSDPEPPSFG